MYFLAYYVYFVDSISWHFITADTLISLKHDNACSSRRDGLCQRCDGVPQCFDLSDEAGCTNTSFKFIPIQEAALQTCIVPFSFSVTISLPLSYSPHDLSSLPLSLSLSPSPHGLSSLSFIIRRTKSILIQFLLLSDTYHASVL